MKWLLVVLVPICLLCSCGERGDNMQSWKRVALPEGYADSHILSIDIQDNRTLLGTYGRGALLSNPGGRGWTVFDTTRGLSWDFILGGAWDSNYIILATLGDGVNISTDAGATWKRYGYNFFGIEYLYAVDAVIKDGAKLIPTADGLVIFNSMDSITDWRAVTEKQGLASQYLYDIAVHGDTIALGTLHGYSLSYDNGVNWINFAPNGKFISDSLPNSKVRAVEFIGATLYAGCDDGLYVSNDKGGSWTRLGKGQLTSDFIHDLILAPDGTLWIAAYKEIAAYNPANNQWQVYNKDSGLPDGSINCLGVTQTGQILAGTHYGLYELIAGHPQKQPEMKVDAAFLDTEPPKHQWMLRPVAPEEQNCKDQTYLYGSTMGGNFRQHQGNEYNNPEGVPLRAVDDGIIVYTDTSIGHTVLKCGTKEEGNDIFAHYHHQRQILKQVGDKVKKGETIGTVGKKGNVTNEHLHFETAYTDRDSAKDSVSHTRNSELWVEPLPGCGTIVGLLVDSDNRPVPGARIYGVTKPIPSETPFSFAETYKDKVNPDDYYRENFAIGDVPAGDYIIYSTVGNSTAAVKVHVESGKFTRVKMRLK